MAAAQNRPYKVFNDPIHGSIKLHPLLVRIIDTPEFQRLRHIKQMGSVYFVYPGASHSRFEHSIGVAHLAGELVKALNEQYHRHPDETLRDMLDLGDGPLITEDEGLCVQIAALCHDLGHGPFSHLFDDRFLPKAAEVAIGDKRERLETWTHENQSTIMLRELVQRIDDPDWRPFMRTNINFINEMIDPPGENVQQRQNPKAFLYEIVSNKRNGIDVDKMDYFARDCHYLGIENNFNCRRFFEFARVCMCDEEMQICMRDKEVRHIYDLYHTRNNIHQKACQHKVVGAIDTMIVDALLLADETLQISDTACNPNVTDYINLTDGIYQKILDYENPNADMRRAQEILQRINHRDLYKCVHNIYVKSAEIEAITQENRNNLAEELQLRPEDIEARIAEMTYGMKGEDPINHMKFYTKHNPCEARNLKRRDISRLLPDVFSEQVVQVFCKRQRMSHEEITRLEPLARQWWGHQAYYLRRRSRR